jgi:hypothetical protein
MIPPVALVSTKYYGLLATSYPFIAIATGYISLAATIYLMKKDGIKLTLVIYFIAFFIATTTGTIRILAVLGIIYSTFATEYSFQFLGTFFCLALA